MNFADHNKILQFTIFLLRDGQLRLIHVILGFKPISRCLQSLKHVIKAKDPMLALFDIAILGFFTGPPPPNTQDAGLPAQLATKLFYSHEQTIPSNEKREEPISEPTQANIKKDFESILPA